MLFNTIKPINVSLNGFKAEHNELAFDICPNANSFKSFAIFNNELYCLNAEDDAKLDAVAKKALYTGTHKGRASIIFEKHEYTVEYDFVFINGNLVNVKQTLEKCEKF